MSSCNCLIERLFDRSFGSRTFDEKKVIIEHGRPIPFLNITTVIKRCTRHFSNQYYEQFVWLTGCKEKNKLFCWACVLFANEKSVWNSTGFSDINNLSKAAKRHSKESSSHLSAIIKLQTFGQSRIENLIDSTRILSIRNHNEKVKTNRDIMKSLIDVVCHLGLQEMPFRGDDESRNSINRGNFIETVNLLATYHPILKKSFRKRYRFLGNV